MPSGDLAFLEISAAESGTLLKNGVEWETT
jgi:hypothetical protein